MRINSSALDLLVHVDFPVRDISEAAQRGSVQYPCICVGAFQTLRKVLVRCMYVHIPISSWVA